MDSQKETLEINHYNKIKKDINKIKNYYDIMSSPQHFAADERASKSLGLTLHYIGNLRASNGGDRLSARNALYGECDWVPSYINEHSPFEWRRGRLCANDGSEIDMFHLKKGSTLAPASFSCDDPVDSFFIK